MPRIFSFLMIAFFATPAWAGGVGEFSILGTESVRLEKEAKVLSGVVGVNDRNAGLGDEGYELVMEKGVLVEGDAALKAPGIHIKTESRIKGDVYYRDTLRVDPGAVVSGDTTALDLPEDWPLAVIAPSPVCAPDVARPVVIAKEKQTTLSPGAYGAWTIGKSAEVTLASGRYDVESVTVDKEAKVYFDGPVVLCVAERFYMGKESLISPVQDSGWKAADVSIHVHGGDTPAGGTDEDDEGSAVTIGKNSIMFGRVWALSGTVEVKKASQVTGSLVGKNIIVDKGSVVVWDTTPTVADTTSPEILGVNPGEGSVVDTLTPVISASFSDDNSGVDALSVRIVLNGVDVTPQAMVSVSGFSLTPAGLTEGPQGVEIFVKDLAGNAALAASHFTIDVDVTLPEIVGVQPGDGAALQDATPLLSAGFLDADSGIDVGSIRIVLDGTDITGLTGANAAGFSYIVSPELADGAHSFEIEVKDLSGNSAQAVRTFTTDVTGPEVAVMIPADGSLMAMATPEVSGTWSDAATAVDVGSVKVFVDGASVSVLGAVITTAGFQVPIVMALGDGGHGVRVEVKDTAGNSGQATNSFTTDTTPPVVSDVTPANGAVLTTNLPVISLNYTDATSGIDPAGVRITVDTMDVTSQATVTETSLQYVPVSPLNDGPHQVSVRVVDVSDHFVDVDFSFQVMTDTLPPVISNLVPVNGVSLNTATPALSGSFSDNLSGVNPASVVLTLDHVDITAGAAVSAIGFSVVPGALSDGEHRLTVQVRDNNGNQAEATTLFTVDTVDPNLKDQDGDGFTPAAGDCNDGNAAIHPNAVDFPDNNIDENCDGADTVVVPDVAGLTEADAQAAIASAHLTVGTLTSDHSETVPSGAVISQTPAAGEIVPRGTIVNLMISLGRALGGLPPDPATVAPPLNSSGITNFVDATAFLYSGDQPIQTGVQPGTLEPRRVAVLRGKVSTRDGVPLPGVAISIANNPELGNTMSRADGRFDLAVNGGGTLTVRYQKDGFLPSDRQVRVSWQDFEEMPDVVLIPADTAVTEISLASAVPFQVARGSSVSDSDGIRQGTLLVPQGTQARMVIPGQGEQDLSAMSIRITEYTVGPQGSSAMPATLPATSAYTYAFEVNADEAVAAGASGIQFNQPLVYYVDNFLGFPAGIPVPTGYYDTEKGQWLPSDNGRVIQIVSIDNGVAQLDIDGSGQPATATALAGLGISEDEQRQLALLYEPGKSLWRALLPHFSKWDLNWGYGLPEIAQTPDGQTRGADPKSQECWNKETGSIIECQSQVLGESIPVTGTPFTLNYRSSRSHGARSTYVTKINLVNGPVPPSVKRVVLETAIAGQFSHQEFSPADNLEVTFTWDGKDAYGRLLNEPRPAIFRIGYVYDAVYDVPTRFGYNGNGMLITGTRPGQGLVQTRQELTLWQEITEVLGPLDARTQRLGGWTLDVHHTYDPLGRVFYGGDGTKKQLVIGNSVAATMNPSLPSSQLVFPTALDAGPDGSLYILDGDLVRRFYPDGSVVIVAGGGNPVDGFGDGGPATEAKLHAGSQGGIAVAPDGTFYVSDTYGVESRIRRVTPDGIISTFAGGGNDSPAGVGDGGPATSAYLKFVQGLALGPDGSLYIADRGNSLVRKVDPAGIITSVAGGIAALDVAVGEDGNVYVSELQRIRRIGPDGVITTIAGDCQPDALECARFENGETPIGLAVAPDQSVYFASSSNHIFRLNVGSILSTFAGTGQRDFTDSSGPATQITVAPWQIALSPDGALYFTDYFNSNQLRKISPAFPGFLVGDIQVASEDGTELYIFDNSGHHLRTISALTGQVLYQFAYTPFGLSAITDRDGNVTTIERNAAGSPTAIVAPFGQRSTLHVDANGYLDQFTHPNGDTYQLAASSEGLLTQLINPRNNTWTFTYDALGRLIRDENALLASSSLSREDLSDGFKVTFKDALNRATFYESRFLENGEEHRLNTLPDGTQYASVIRPDWSLSTEDPDGTTVDTIRGPDPRLGMQAPILKKQTIRTPAGLTSVLETTRLTNASNPDDIFSFTSIVDIVKRNGKTYTNSYDLITKTLTTTTPLNRAVTVTFDNRERVVKKEIFGVHPVRYTYDAQGRLIRTAQGPVGDERTADLNYNANGFLNQATNSLGETTAFIYDGKSRVTQQILPDGRVIEYTYDAGDNVTSITPPGRPGHGFDYTPVDLQSQYTPPDVNPGSDATVYSYNLARQVDLVTRPDGQTIDFDYDLAGRVAAVVVPQGPYVYGYDTATGQPATVQSPYGITLAYTYDGFLPLSATWTGAVTGTIARGYDNNFRVVSETINDSSAVGFGYDDDGLLTTAGGLNLTYNAINGLLTGSSLGV